MMSPRFSIREANSNDIPSIMELILLKAEFDGCPESVTATPEKLENTLFTQKPIEFVLLAEIEKKAIGFATYHFIYSTFLARSGIWLDDLYVKAEYRGKGIGEELIKHLWEIARESDCGRIDWTVAVNNARGIKFYERMGAKIIDKVRLCRLDLASEYTKR
jgi:ribosomal protein S18 acetylase RimI-like enzyme